jgi:3-phenylpropionate/cinnamic acid dioxygenase small subunit
MTELASRPTDELPVVDPALIAFVHREARLADEARYSEWESLWADDGVYWVPMHPDDDPTQQIAYVYDNRARIKSRIAQLNSGARHSQTPPSMMRRIVGNFEVTSVAGDIATVESNFALYEYRYALTVWAGRYRHRIRTSDDGLRLVSKTVNLVNAGGPIPTMSFLV